MEELSATFQSRQELWQSRIFAYRSSGLTAKDWCEKNQVSLSALRYWITKTNRSGEKDEPASSETVFAKLPSEEEIAKVMGNAPVTIFSNGLLFVAKVKWRILQTRFGEKCKNWVVYHIAFQCDEMPNFTGVWGCSPQCCFAIFAIYFILQHSPILHSLRKTETLESGNKQNLTTQPDKFCLLQII